MDQLQFIPGQHIVRREIHARFGGNPQSGISSSAKFPYIFIFTGSQGEKHGYKDRWENPNVFSYTWEGQSGDMEFSRGNKILRDHLSLGKRVFLFKYVKRGLVMFDAELEFNEVAMFQIPDTSGVMREGIKFFFQRKGVLLPAYAKEILLEEYSDPPMLYKVDVPTSKERLVTTRVGQGAYRKSIIHRWEYQCAVTTFHHKQVLIASHIVPWKHATDNERLDVDNGILLSPTYDALFDRHLISFENSGRIILSSQIETDAFGLIGVTGNERVKTFSTGNMEYLERHREFLMP